MKKIYFVLIGIIFSNSLYAQRDSAPYLEKYRPQFHYTPAHRWMGDPSGLIKYNGKYKAYNWGRGI